MLLSDCFIFVTNSISVIEVRGVNSRNRNITHDKPTIKNKSSIPKQNQMYLTVPSHRAKEHSSLNMFKWSSTRTSKQPYGLSRNAANLGKSKLIYQLVIMGLIIIGFLVLRSKPAVVSKVLYNIIFYNITEKVLYVGFTLLVSL